MASANLTATITVDYWRGWLHPVKVWRRYRSFRRDGNQRLAAFVGAWVIASARVNASTAA